LLVEAGQSSRQFSALAAPLDPRGMLRAAYAVPTELIGSGSRFSLKNADGSVTELPQPAAGRAAPASAEDRATEFEPGLARPEAPSAIPARGEPPLASSRPPGFSVRSLLSGSGWGAFSQFVPLAINIVLTPYVIHGFGLSRYGLFLLTTTIVSFLGSFDGGLASTSFRFLAVLAGRDDRVGTTRLLCTVSGIVLLFASVLSAGAWVLATPISHVVHMPGSLRPEAVFLFRTLAALVGLGIVRGVLNAAIGVRQRFAFVSLVDTSLYGIYVIGIVLSVSQHWGLRGIAITFVVMQLLSILGILPALRRYVVREGVGLLSRAELREFFSYAGKIQLVGIAGLVNNEVDSLIIAALFPVRQVGLFQAGGNFASQAASVPVNAMGPITVLLGNTYGRHGRPALDREFAYLQRRWVQVTVGWSAAALGAVWFGITAWLGPRFDASGTIAVMLMAAACVSLLLGVMLPYVQVLGRPGLEARYALAGMAINIALTIPLALTGIIGIAAATAAAGAGSALYFLRLVRRELGPEVPSFLSDLPLSAGCATLVVCVALELLLRPVVPHGPLGLLLSALPAGVSLLIYWFLVAGPGRTIYFLSHLGTFLRNPRELLLP